MYMRKIAVYSNHQQPASYHQGKYLVQQFNYDLNLNDNFKYKPKGQICYIGNGNSVYDYKNTIYFKGKLTGYLNNFIHIYNCINNKIKIIIFKIINMKYILNLIHK